MYLAIQILTGNFVQISLPAHVFTVNVPPYAMASFLTAIALNPVLSPDQIAQGGRANHKGAGSRIVDNRNQLTV